MTTTQFIRIASGFALILLAGCGGGRGVLEDEQNGDGTKRKAPLGYYESTLRPSEFDEEVEAVQKAHAQTGSVTPIDLPNDSSFVEIVETQGYRVQIFASASIDEATAAQRVASNRVGDSVYVVYDPPVYKVRVGDYALRLEANQRLTRVVNMGYDDAWVVADKIYLRRVTRVSRTE
ncbi:MAG: SPOR domain-containing protein [Bacteroidota bacterium]